MFLTTGTDFIVYLINLTSGISYTTAAFYLEPMVLLRDVFEDIDIEVIQALSFSARQQKSNAYSASRNF